MVSGQEAASIRLAKGAAVATAKDLGITILVVAAISINAIVAESLICNKQRVRWRTSERT